METDLPQRTIFIVDDESGIRALLCELLSEAGFAIREAIDGASALRTLRGTAPDLIMLDLALPDINGLLLLDLIHAQEPLRHVPVMFLTGDMDPPTKVQAFEKGAVDYVTKPFDLRELVARIRSQIARKDELETRRHEAAMHAEQAEHSLRLAEQRLKTLVENSFDLVSELDGEMRVAYASPNHRDILGCDAALLAQTPWLDRVHSEDRSATAKAFCNALESGSSIRTLTRFCDNAGAWRWLDVSGSVLDPAGNASRLLLVSRDITDTKQTQAHLAHLVLHDSLTGLGNRQMLEDELDALTAQEKRSGRDAVIFLDLDNFKLVNDTKGHHAGDQVLCSVASTLREVLGESCVICRVGGDEFCVVLRDAGADAASGVCERILTTFQQHPIAFVGRRYGVTLSAGIALLEPGITGEELLSRADSALYAAKASGKNRCRLYTTESEEIARIRDSAEWYHRVQEALAEERFELHYQPILNLRDNTVLCHEALLRYRDEDGVWHAPRTFLAAAERYNLMSRLDRYVVDRVLTDLAAHPELRVSVNLSGQSVVEPEMGAFLFERFAHRGIAPQRAVFEITETVFISNLDAARELVAQLKHERFSFALDDFGAGFSSLSYLRNLPVEIVKIDGSFVDRICEDPVDLALLRSINEIAHLLGKWTIAEFVDSPEKQRILSELGVDFGQGFFLGRATPLAAPLRALQESVSSPLVA